MDKARYAAIQAEARKRIAERKNAPVHESSTAPDTKTQTFESVDDLIRAIQKDA